ncbi:PorT family protein [Hymenobacter sp. NBH84]|uniref:porin family protein n=1 Tax=Hymenobacter sp. NBH84 TaxID=2596915 RepID=UPI001628D1E8|nr:porin family protein [Hymenobacter sp. NBH84]QNE41459.1 PorT family protein [Hymenobacter sp. NBH84]
MKQFFFLLFGLLLSSGAYAQLGVKAGVNQSVLNGENIDGSTSYNTSYHAGVFYEAKLIGPLSVQPELLYSSQGGNIKSQFEDFDTKMHYFTVPVLAKVHVGPLFVEAGPQFSFLLDATKEGTQRVQGTGGAATYNDYKRGATSDFKRGDFSLCAGVGLKFSALLIGARFNAGLNDVNDVDNLTGVNDARLKNRVFQGYVALQLGH